MRRVLVIAAGLAVAACGGDEHGDLKQELNQLTKDFRGRVDPLPQVKPYEPVPYTAEGQVDPFRPERIDVAGARTAPVASNSRIVTLNDVAIVAGKGDMLSMDVTARTFRYLDDEELAAQRKAQKGPGKK